ncbi:MAG: endonuclease I family protein [Bdellovibrionia bacterium]
MKFSFIKTVILFILLSSQAWAYRAAQSTLIPYYGEEFYQQLKSGATGEDLMAKIKQVLRSYHIRQGANPDIIAGDCQGQGGCYRHESIGYGRARIFLLGNFYLVRDNNGYGVKDVYCDTVRSEREFGKGARPGPNQIPDNTVVNTEHTWPQSRFNGRHPDDYQKSDLHHLFPTDSQLNAIRGNHPFGEVVRDQQNLKCASGARFGMGDGRARRDVFEPPQGHKGNVARALFYFSLRYDLPIDQDEEATLRKWHREDPVDNEEVTRNEEIFKIQGNRNPFIDFPDVVDKINNF